MPSPVYPGFLATALCDGGDAAILLHLRSVLESIPVFTEGSEKPGREDETGAWQGSEHWVVGQRGCKLCDGLVELFDELDCGPELCGKGQWLR